MMMIGELTRSHPTVQVPPWDHYDDPRANIFSPYSPTNNPSVHLNGNANAAPSPMESPIAYDFSALQRFLPSNDFDAESDTVLSDELDLPFDSFACDNFRMFEFKVRRCARGTSHDWTECPFAHPGEKARRRDPRKYHYSGAACPEFRKGQCKKGDSCEFAHGVFECWLHPARYRTLPCKDGPQCKRRVCFFAHSAVQLRVLPQNSTGESYGSAPNRLTMDSFLSTGSFGSSPTSILVSRTVSPPSDSPPMSPSGVSYGSNSVGELVGATRGLQIGKVGLSPRSWGLQVGSGYGSPRSPTTLRSGLGSLPSTPTKAPNRSGLCIFDAWDTMPEEEPAMERVESGRDLRAKMYAKLGKENSLHRAEPADLGTGSESVK
ncbi:hypothetical protein Nepgr_013685 [Nepenthes gracilis]|uniref:C3H1-type domain-containing protein n=1 Tax=Nepenthes gracilis TaxID=150966 RepID=A0AAD3SJA9_NEPGR|nr:hypothetical protein Nepgr_013685 [Nepenthes gracilis]